MVVNLAAGWFYTFFYILTFLFVFCLRKNTFSGLQLLNRLKRLKLFGESSYNQRIRQQGADAVGSGKKLHCHLEKRTRLDFCCNDKAPQGLIKYVNVQIPGRSLYNFCRNIFYRVVKSKHYKLLYSFGIWKAFKLKDLLVKVDLVDPV